MKKISRRSFLQVAGASAVAFGLAACGDKPASSTPASSTPASSTPASSTPASSGDAPAEKKTVKVAVMNPMSGQSQQFYPQYKAAIETAMTIVAEDDMLKNYELEFEYIDDKGTTDGAPTAANYALDQYGCNVSIGHMLTTMILADGQYFEDAETPLIGIVSGPASVSQGWEYLCIATGTDLVQGDTLVDYLVGNKGLKKISLVNINTEGGITAATEIERYLKDKYGLDLATHEQMANEDTDYASVALKMKNAGTDCVIYWGLSQANGQLCFDAVRDYVGADVFFAGGTNLAQNQMLTTWRAEAIEGVVFPVGYIPDPSNALQDRICPLYQTKSPDNVALTDVPARVVDAVFHIVTALNAMGAQDPAAKDFNKNLNAALRAASFDGVQGHFDFSSNDNGVGLNSMNIGIWDKEFNQSKVQW